MIEAAVYTPKNMKKKEEKIIFVSNIYTQFNLNFCCIFKHILYFVRTLSGCLGTRCKPRSQKI